ncbi:MAG: hypothetical protein GXO88_09755 [Chlorobi bacterium]|nr:hypothetical protein [Chlorobiota bacterium]
MEANTKLSRTNFWSIVVNSTSSFVIAYLIVFYLNYFATLLSTAMFGFDVSFDFDQILYHIEPYQWTNDSVKMIFGSGPLLVFLLGLISLIGYFGLTEEQSRMKVLFVWLSLIAFNQTFGSLMIGNIFKTGVGHVFNWMYFNDTQKMLVALVGFFGLITTAFLMVRPVAMSANSYFNKLDGRNFPFFIMSQFILPFLFGYTLIIIYFWQRLLFQEEFAWISLSILILIIAFRVSSLEKLYFDEDDRRPGISKFLVILAISMYVGLRIILSGLYTIHW